MNKANLEIQEGVNFHLFCYCNFLVSTRKLRKETRKLYLRSLIICNARAKQVNSVPVGTSNSTCSVILSLTMIIRSDRLAKNAVAENSRLGFLPQQKLKAEHCLRGKAPSLRG